MADTLEKRIADLEYMLAHVPEDLDARFAGLDVKFAELRELILLQNNRFTKLEARFNETIAKLTVRLDDLARKVDVQGRQLDDLTLKGDAQGAQLNDLTRKVDAQVAQLNDLTRKIDAQGAQLNDLARKVDVQGRQLDDLTLKVDAQAGKLDEILARLPKP